jgi:hypothetical protein
MTCAKSMPARSRLERSALALTVIVAVAGVGTVAAGTTGQLSGFVFNEDGLPLQSVRISASSPAQIGAVQLAETESDGSFRFLRLAPGYYTVLVELVGYGPQQLEEVQVRLDRETQVQVILSQTSYAGQIQVSEVTPVVDPTQVSVAQTYTTEYITVTRTDWTSLITQTPGASSDSFRRVMGSTPQDGGYLLDGMDSTNWYQRHPNLAAFAIPFDAVQEVAVHSAGFEAEYGQATGALVNVSTKSGGNQFSGTVDVRYTGSDLETSGEHYDPDEQGSEDSRIAATFGGPIIRDRLWFFTSYNSVLYKTTPTGAPTTFTRDFDHYLAKLTWLPASSWSVVGKYTSAPGVEDDRGTSQFRAADATAIWRLEPLIATLEGVGILSPNLLWEVRVGRKEWDESGVPADGDLETIGHLNLMTGEYSANWSSQWYAQSWQNEASTDLTWLVDAAGSHELKLGLGWGDPSFVDESCLNGSGQRCSPGLEGYFFRDLVGADGAAVPYVMDVIRGEGPLEYGGHFYIAYLQDAWRLRSNLTAKLGLRWDRSTYDNQTGEIADLSKLQPRVGIAWDLSGDGKTSLRASWGRFMHPGTTILATLTNQTNYPTEYWLSCSTLISADPDICAAFAESAGLGYRSDPEGWDPAGWFLDPGNIVASEPSQTVDDLRPGYSDQWLVAFERELFRRTSLELTYVNKAGEDGFDDTCNGNYPEPSADAACDFYLVANLPEVRWDYKAWMLRFESQVRDNLYLLASWVISDSMGSIDSNTGATGAFDFYPYHYVNRYGHLLDHSRHRVKLNGYWLLPYDFSVAVNGWWQSEFRWTPFDPTVPGMPYGSVFVEPRGSGVGGSLHQLDLQLSKGFRIGPTRLVVLGTIINATDSQNENEVCENVNGCGDFVLGEGTAWQQPRRYELGFRFEF